MGSALCIAPGCKRQQKVKGTRLCARHYSDRRAAGVLRQYLDSYESSYSGNNRYMSILASTIDWKKVDDGNVEIKGQHLARFRAIGSFLQSYKLPEAITWVAIETALPQLGGTNAQKIQFIRSSLLQLGELLAERGEIEDRSRYLDKGILERILRRCPPCFRKHVIEFFKWRSDAMLNPDLDRSRLNVELVSHAPRTLVESTAAIVRFLAFCADRQATTLTEIEPDVVHAYQELALWGLECKQCKHSRSTRGPSGDECSKCGVTDAYVRTKRLTRGTVVRAMSVIRFFFDWALLKNLIPESPFKGLSYGAVRSFTVRSNDGNMIEVATSIRKYNDSVVQELCAYIVAPETDPEEALVLYLIIFHLLTNGELRNLRVPSLTEREVNRDADLKYLYLPLREPTLGHRTLRRTNTKIAFPRKALPWLIPILKRFYAKRECLLTGAGQRHLLVGQENNKCGRPVSKHYITKVVRDASLKSLGAIVTPSDLQRTAAHILSEHAKKRGAVLTQMGFSGLSATQFNYYQRFTIIPKRPSQKIAA
jgi:site-specific recombinase XerD